MRLIKKIGTLLRKNSPYLYRKAMCQYYMPGLRRRILRDRKRYPDRYSDPELSQAVDYIRRNGTGVFPHPFREKYDSLRVEVLMDDQMPYVLHNGHRLYFPFPGDPAKVARVYRSLLCEQDPESPHRYTINGFGVDRGSVLFDIGAAEGIFALDNVDKASRVFLFEADPVWIAALRKTFEPWKDKVVIINKYVSDMDGTDRDGADTASATAATGATATTTADSVVREYGIDAPIFLKLDVEGAEADVLKGAHGILSRNDSKAVICTYHKYDDHRSISQIMDLYEYNVRTSRGYMLFVYDDDQRSPFFRRGVIYCQK